MDHTEAKPVRGYNYSKVRPTAIIEPYIAAYSESCMRMIGVSPELINDQAKNKELAEYLCGNKLCEGSDPVSHCYCGF